jgi:hypothetical protein
LLHCDLKLRLSIQLQAKLYSGCRRPSHESANIVETIT